MVYEYGLRINKLNKCEGWNALVIKLTCARDPCSRGDQKLYIYIYIYRLRNCSEKKNTNVALLAHFCIGYSDVCRCLGVYACVQYASTNAQTTGPDL